MDHHVHLEILFRLEALLALQTLKVCCKNTNIPASIYYASASYKLLKSLSSQPVPASLHTGTSVCEFVNVFPLYISCMHGCIWIELITTTHCQITHNTHNIFTIMGSKVNVSQQWPWKSWTDLNHNLHKYLIQLGHVGSNVKATDNTFQTCIFPAQAYWSMACRQRTSSIASSFVIKSLSQVTSRM